MPIPTPSRFVGERRGRLPSPEELFAESAAGMAVSGDSGTGKSTFLLGLMKTIIGQGFGLTLLDPHGDLASDLERHCASLPDRIRSKIVVLRFHETKRLPALNPLAVDHIKGDEFRRRAMIASKVGHVTKVLLSAWGESGTASRPTLAKWLNRFLTMLARCGLTIPDVRHFFDTSSSVYHALTAAAPDFVSRLEMEQLADLKPREREDEIASTKNRCLGYLSNPIVECVLGSPEYALSFRDLIQQQGVLIVDLSRGGVLRDEDVEIFANLILHEVLYAAFNMPRAERVPHFVFADELPVFASSFDLITWALTQVRKFKLRFCCAFQGTQLFEERTEDRLLNALIGQCNCHVMFRHKNPVDARFFADIVHLPSADPWKIKHVLKTPQQYQDGHDLVTLVDEAENWSDANQSGTGESTATSDTRTESTGNTTSRGDTTTESRREEQLRDAVSRARSETTGTSRSNSTAQGQTQTSNHSSSTTSTRGGGRTFKQSLVPRVKTRDIVSSIQFLTLDEQIAQIAGEIARLPVGSALLSLAGRIARVRFPLPKDPLARTPKFAQKKVTELVRMIHARPEFQSPAERADARLHFERRLIEHLHAMAIADTAPRIVLLPRSAGEEHLTI
jgi:hypothetical protein